jgi:CheY-like chemotaxis protein
VFNAAATLANDETPNENTAQRIACEPVVERTPVMQRPAAEVAGEVDISASDAKQTAASPRRRLLVVDDNRDFTDTMAVLLEAIGHEVRTAYDGREVAAIVAEFKPQVVLLDIGLPGIDGYEVARRLRASPQYSGTVLIAVSGYGQQADRNRAQEAGFDHHLVKPVDPDKLAGLIESLAQE